jgi:kinesin family member 6/9
VDTGLCVCGFVRICDLTSAALPRPALTPARSSERTGKTHASGLLLREATSINKSLHYLELVIGALQEARPRHVPYRNSLLTCVLRDSLGGNCKTAMVATLNPEAEHTDEGITTCRFAQRVAGVSNDAVVNTEVDPGVLIGQLRARVAALEGEVTVLRGGGGGGGDDGEAADSDNVLPDERAAIAAAVDAWVAGATTAPTDAASAPGDTRLVIRPLTPARVQVAFSALRSLVALARAGSTLTPASASASAPPHESQPHSQQQPQQSPAAAAKPGGGAKEVAQLRAEVAQLRAALVQQQMLGMLAVGGAGGGGATGPGQPPPPPLPPSPAFVPAPPPTPTPTPFRLPPICLPSGAPVPDDVLRDRDRARRAFKAVWHGAPALAENEAALQATYARAQEAAAAVNAARDATTALRAAIERRRLAAAVSEITAAAGGGASASSGAAAVEEASAAGQEEEARLVSALEGAKSAYKARYEALRGLKGEVEGTQRVLEGLALRLQAEFDAWYTGALVTLAGAAAAARAAPPPQAVVAVAPLSATSRPPTPLTRPGSAASLPPPVPPPYEWARPPPLQQQRQQPQQQPTLLNGSPPQLPPSWPPSAHALQPPPPAATGADGVLGSSSWALRPPPPPPPAIHHRYPSSDALLPSPLPVPHSYPPTAAAGYVLSSSASTVGEASSVDADVAAFLAAKQALLLQQHHHHNPPQGGSFRSPAATG